MPSLDQYNRYAQAWSPTISSANAPELFGYKHRGAFGGQDAEVPRRMGQTAINFLDWFNQTGPPDFTLNPEFENRQYEQMSRIMARNRQADEKRIMEAFGRANASNTPGSRASLLSNMIASQQVLGDMIQQSAMQNALRRLDAIRALGSYQMGMSQIMGDWSKHPLPGWTPPKQKKKGGWQAIVGDTLGQMGGLVGNWAASEWGSGGSNYGPSGGYISSPQMPTMDLAMMMM